MEEIIVNYGIQFTLILIAIAAGLTLLFGVFQMLMSPKNAIKTIVAVAVLAAIIFGIYSIAPGEVTGIFKSSKYVEDMKITSGILKYAHTGILTSLFLIALATVAWIVLEIINIFR